MESDDEAVQADPPDAPILPPRPVIGSWNFWRRILELPILAWGGLYFWFDAIGTFSRPVRLRLDYATAAVLLGCGVWAVLDAQRDGRRIRDHLAALTRALARDEARREAEQVRDVLTRAHTADLIGELLSRRQDAPGD